MWRRLGARCQEITNLGNDRFAWTDGQGTELHWVTLCRNGHCRVWYAEGTSRPSPLFPTVPVRALVILRYGQEPTGEGNPLIYHQADLYAQTDSKTAALVARLLGPSAPRLAGECVGQMEMFFSALVWYLGRHPEMQARLVGEPPAERTEPSLPAGSFSR